MLFSWFFKPPQKANRQQSRRRKLTLETLEERELLSVSPLAAPFGVPVDFSDTEQTSQLFSTEDIANTANDPNLSAQWGLDMINVAGAWNSSALGSGVVIATLDHGTTLNHPDLQQNAWINTAEIDGDGIDNDGNGYVDDYYGWNFAGNNADVTDLDGHGTHVAGIIGAALNNGIGGAGAAPEAQILPLKVIEGSTASTSNLVKAIDYLIDLKVRNGVNIAAINMSLGYPGEDPAVRLAIQRAGDAGIVVVASAGNEGKNNDVNSHYPSNYNDLDNVISVASMDQNGNLASNSNYGLTTVDLAAPGVSIYSTTKDGGYGNMSGTSMAAPFVTAAAAILAAQEPSLTPVQIKARILDSVEPLTTLTGKVVTGGRLDIGKMLNPPVVALPEVTATAKNDRQIVVSWDAVPDAAKYIVERSTDGIKWQRVATVAAAKTEVQISGHKAGTEYLFRVTPVTKTGNGETLQTVSVTTKLPTPGIPRIKAAGSNSVEVSWNKIKGAGGYRVERLAEGSTEWQTVTVIYSGETKTYTDTTCNPNTMYQYRIVALKNPTMGESEGVQSNESKARSIKTAPPPPTGLTVLDTTDRQVILRWNETAGATRYMVERWNGKRWVLVRSAASNDTTIRSLKPDTEYLFRVVALNKTIKSTPGDEIIVVTGSRV